MRDEGPAAPPPPVVGSSREPSRELDAAHSRLLRIVIGRDRWSEADFAEAARKLGLMPAGARETLNDWALKRYDDVLIDDDDPMTVNRALVADGIDELV